MVLSPAGSADPAVAIAAARAGAIGALDLEFVDDTADEALERLLELGHGRVGLHTAAACRAAGAAGVVLDSQVLLARESPLGETARGRLSTMDGSETIVLGPPGATCRLRVYTRPGSKPVDELRALETGDTETFVAAARAAVDWRDGLTGVLAVGQDAAFAADLGRRFRTVGGIVAAVRE